MVKSFSEFMLNENLEKIKAKYGIGETIDGCIGFSEKNKKWYGWSHRAICGFKVGDKVFEADFGDDDTPFNKHGSADCKTLDDCKRAAKAFADYVS